MNDHADAILDLAFDVVGYSHARTGPHVPGDRNYLLVPNWDLGPVAYGKDLAYVRARRKHRHQRLPHHPRRACQQHDMSHFRDLVSVLQYHASPVRAKAKRKEQKPVARSQPSETRG